MVAPNDFPGLRLPAVVTEVGQEFSRPDQDASQVEEQLIGSAAGLSS